MFKSPLITTVDTHTQGEPTRVVTGGVGHIPGADMPSKKKWFARHKDHIRRFLLWEPRGHQDMFGAIVTDPATPGAEVGLLFMDGGGYLDMCGHGCMGSVVALIETGVVPIPDQEESIRSIILDTPSGQIQVKAHFSQGQCAQVSLLMPPAFWHSTTTVQLGENSIPVDIAYGGNFFGLVDVESSNVHLDGRNVDELKKVALALRQELNRRLTLVHPVSGDKAEVALIELYQEGQPTKNVVIFGSGQVDRSPCGTGTCAKMAMLHKYGKLECGHTYIQQGILGTQFTGCIIQNTTYGSWPAVIPEVSGKAFVTGFHHFVAQPQDPFEFGFQLCQRPR
ncbi:MAG: proline racemase family protein [Desulfovermiculus sp.]|nr:proline racemase family protein [Desulfovermiculus sp.]